MTMGRIDWESTKKDVENAIRQIYSDKKFVKTHYLSQEVWAHPSRYPMLKDLTLRKVKIRIDAVLTNHLRWKSFSDNGHGKTFIKPEGWK